MRKGKKEGKMSNTYVNYIFHKKIHMPVHGKCA